MKGCRREGILWHAAISAAVAFLPWSKRNQWTLIVFPCCCLLQVEHLWPLERLYGHFVTNPLTVSLRHLPLLSFLRTSSSLQQPLLNHSTIRRTEQKSHWYCRAYSCSLARAVLLDKCTSIPLFDDNGSVLTELGGISLVTQGLSEQQVIVNRGLYGENKLTPGYSAPWWLKFLLQFTNFFSILLLVASILCFVAYGIDKYHDKENVSSWES